MLTQIYQSGAAANFGDHTHRQIWGPNINNSGRQNQRPIVPDEWHNHTGRVAVTADLSDGRVAIIEQNTK